MLAVDKGLSYQTVCGHQSAIARQHIGVGGVPLGMLQDETIGTSHHYQ